MLSKYPIHPDYFDVEDTEPAAEASLWSPDALKAENNSLLPLNQELIAEAKDIRTTCYEIAGYEDKKFSLLLFTPEDLTGQLSPLIFNIHGGGFAGGIFPHQLSYGLRFARELKCRVAMPDYRTALTSPFPGPFLDCYHAFQWIMEHAGDLHVKKDRIILYGDSAGGSIAAAVCQKARDEGSAMPSHLVLLYPTVDCDPSGKSIKTFWTTPGFAGCSYQTMYDYYLKNGDCGMPQYAMPLRAEDVSGFPPVYMEVMECDPLHDEGLAYAVKLKEAGVSVEYLDIRQGFHGFDMWADKPFAQKGVSRRIKALRKFLQ